MRSCWAKRCWFECYWAYFLSVRESINCLWLAIAFMCSVLLPIHKHKWIIKDNQLKIIICLRTGHSFTKQTDEEKRKKTLNTFINSNHSYDQPTQIHTQQCITGLFPIRDSSNYFCGSNVLNRRPLQMDKTRGDFTAPRCKFKSNYDIGSNKTSCLSYHCTAHLEICI